MAGFSNLSDNEKIFNKDAWGVTTIGLLITGIISSVLLGVFFQSGLGKFVDGFTGLIVALFCLIVGAFFSFIFVRISNSFPSFFKVSTGAVLFSLAVFMLMRKDLSVDILFFFVFGIILLQGFLAGLIWTMLSGRLRFILYQKRLWVRFLTLAIISIDIGIYFLLVASVHKDVASYTPKLNKSILEAMPPNTIVSDSFRINSFYYGSGTDKQREAYQQGVAFKSETFNLSEILPEVESYFGSMFRWFWGFDAASIPLNAHVWMPESDSLQHELVLIVHSSSALTSDSENGFNYLAEVLSSMGYLVVIPDLNFFNGIWLDLPREEKLMAKSIVLQKHLEVIKSWSLEEGHEMFDKFDSLGRTSIIGHGDGAGVSRALIGISKVNKLPYNANILSNLEVNFTKIIEFAPEQVSEKTIERLKNIPHLAIHAGYNIETQIDTYQPFISFTDTTRYLFSNSMSMYQANYAQFNEVFDGRDLRPPYNWLINQVVVMSGKSQREVVTQIVAAFMSSASGNLSWLPMMQNAYYIKSLPREYIYINQFKDNQFYSIASFEEDKDPETTTFLEASIEGNNLNLWQEVDYQQSPSYTEKGLVLGWDNSNQQNISKSTRKKSMASWTINLTSDFNEGMQLGQDASFVFSLLHLDENDEKSNLMDGNSSKEEKLDFTIEFIDTVGIVNRVALRNFGSAFSIQTPKKYKLPFLNTQKHHLFLQSQYLPLKRFSALNPDFDVNTLGKIRFVFDKSTSGKILLDNIGFSKNYTEQKTNNNGDLEP